MSSYSEGSTGRRTSRRIRSRRWKPESETDNALSAPQVTTRDGFWKAETPFQQDLPENSPPSCTNLSEIELRTPLATTSDGFCKAGTPYRKAVPESSPMSCSSVSENELRTPRATTSRGFRKAGTPYPKAVPESSPMSCSSVSENELRTPRATTSRGFRKAGTPYPKAVPESSPMSCSSVSENELRTPQATTSGGFWKAGTPYPKAVPESSPMSCSSVSENELRSPQSTTSDGFWSPESPCGPAVLESSRLSSTSFSENELKKPRKTRSDWWRREIPHKEAVLEDSSSLSRTCIIENDLLNVSVGLKAKYQGCMVGALIGDCLGSPFEDIPHRHVLPTSELRYFLWRIRRKSVKADDRAGRRFTEDPDHEFGGYYKYTDDTAMTHVLAESLLDCGGFYPTVVAQRFTEEFYHNKDVKGEYGPKVRRVFAALAKDKYEDVYAPAKEQFDGTGSYGNGAAMRVAPVSLYYYGDEERAVQIAQKQSKLTHAHHLGYNAAALVCLAIQLALSLDPSKELDVGRFLDTLKLKMEKIEPEEGRFYSEKLETMKKMLNHYEDAPPERVAAILGNEITADRSVPAALYAFLRSTRPLTGCKTSNGFVRALFFAISMGGDTDTIGTMTGSIAGAYYGIFKVPRNMQGYCQAEERATCLGNRLLAEKSLPK
ncbi:uncharacterized protein LOC119461611 isoform X3 [Dermacentor silvarum]|uniref:uncharacterized protein LOC119461611 isoform X3 n=1 Tax=Dermacentor silvarum TaxID=543639 RepID=UPI00210090AE|nr:uncharacterized protein LOC119461611 isoform X3 [Dermacentor silvarum]